MKKRGGLSGLLIGLGIFLLVVTWWNSDSVATRRTLNVRLPGEFGPIAYQRVNGDFHGGFRLNLLWGLAGVGCLIAGGVFACGERRARSCDVPSSPDFEVELRKLHTLFAEGILSQKEYESSKAAILQRLNGEGAKKE